jgi:hypothetical protein
MTANVFARLAPYGYIHHRALNDFAALADGQRFVAAYPEKHQVFEGDICWNFDGGRQDFYFRHPSYVVDTLSPDVFDAMRAARAIVTLDDLLAQDSPDKNYVIELKVGRGDTRAAMRKLVETLQARCRDRFWLDGFSLRLAQMVKDIDPSVATSLHTEHVKNGNIVIGAPEWPPFRVMPLADVRGVDAIALRKRHSDDFVTRACADIHENGFALSMSRLFTVEDYALSRKLGAIVGYPKAPFEDIIAYDRAHQDISAATQAAIGS